MRCERCGVPGQLVTHPPRVSLAKGGAAAATGQAQMQGFHPTVCGLPGASE